MKHGKKIQMKINKNFITIILIGLVGVATMVFWIISNLKTSMDIKTTSYERMQTRQFVIVRDSRYPDDEVGFDLKSHEFYSSSRVVKNDRTYGIDSTTASALYREWEEFNITYGILKLPITNKQIIDQDYKLEFDAKDFINQKKVSSIHKGDIENLFTKYNLAKVRVTYNKEFLPTKLEGYYEKNGEMSWNTIRTYSYTFKNKSDFDKKLDEQIQLIKEIESEKEED